MEKYLEYFFRKSSVIQNHDVLNHNYILLGGDATLKNLNSKPHGEKS